MAKTAKKTEKKSAPAPKSTRKPRASAVEMAQRELATLGSRKEKLEQFVALSSELFGKTRAVASVPGVKTKGRPVGSKTAGKPTLEVAFRNVLAGKAKGLTIEDAVVAVQKGGYETKATNFEANLRQLVHKMMHADQLKVAGQNGRKNRYALRAAA